MQHYYKNVPGWAAFEQLYIDAVRQFPTGSRFIEVGSWLGRSAALMGVEIENSGKDIEFVCVDPWEDGGPDLRDTQYFRCLDAPVYEIFQRNVAPIAHRLKAMKMESVEASRWFPDQSVDFIMLDGDHSYDAVMKDIEVWLPKMKKGGTMAGDDFTWPGVETAVQRHFHGRAKVSINKGKPRNKNFRLDASFWWVTIR
jgi:predicted O-methyltransferase YrrM